jgi:hypothetical protein
VSGQASSGGLYQPFPSSLQRIEFTDTQTGIVTTFRFTFPSQSDNRIGNYSVFLKNGHSYSVYISYYGGIPPNMELETNYLTTYTVNASAGEKAIIQNFG